MSSSSGGEIAGRRGHPLERRRGSRRAPRRARPGSTSPERSARRMSTLSAETSQLSGSATANQLAPGADLREQLRLLGQRVGVGLVGAQQLEQSPVAAEPTARGGEQPRGAAPVVARPAPRRGRATAPPGARGRRRSRRRRAKISRDVLGAHPLERGRRQQARPLCAPPAGRRPRAARCPRTAPRRRRGGRAHSRCGGPSRTGTARRRDPGRGRTSGGS